MERHNQLPSPFHLFASQAEVGVLCAVRQDRAVPSFIDGEAWVFSGVVSTMDTAPADFDLQAAQAGAVSPGYHLFLALQS